MFNIRSQAHLVLLSHLGQGWSPLRAYKWARLQFAGAVILLEPKSRFTYANVVWMCPNWVIVHANRWLNRQLPNLHEQMEVVHIQKAGGTWTLCRQAAFLKACENLAPGTSELLKSQSQPGLTLHKWNLLFDLSCKGNDQRKYHGKGFDFCHFFPYTLLKAKI